MKLDRKKAPPIKDAVEYSLTLKPYEKFTLKNGVEVYTLNAGQEDVMQVELVFDAGNWYEDQNIIASATNFLLRNGTSRYSAFDINEQFEFYGAHLNRTCLNEFAVVSLHCLTKHLSELLPMTREVLTDAIFPQDELQTYVQNMKQRLQVSEKKADFIANRLIDVYLFGEEHPYGRYSRKESYDAITREQLRAFYDTYYRSGRCRIFVSGKLPADVVSQLDSAFGDLPWRNEIPLRKNHLILPSAEFHHRVINDDQGVQGAIRMAKPMPHRRHPDFAKIQVLNAVFGGFFGSRLMSNIREDKGYTYGIYSYLQNHPGYSALLVSTEAGRDVCESTIQEVYKEMELLREEEVDDEELLLVKNYLIGTLLGELDGPFQIMARWKNIVLNELDEQYFYHSVNTIKGIDAAELQKMARQYLTPEGFYELVVV